MIYILNLWPRLVFLIILLTKTNIYVEGCTCIPAHPQTKVCTSDFVFKGKVLEEELIPGPQPDPGNNFGKYHYTVELIQKIKGIEESKGSNIIIETAGNGAVCGIQLTVGDTYILSGSFDGETKVVLLCDLILNVDNLSNKQIGYFSSCGSNSYRKTCHCQDIRQYDPEASPFTGCTYPADQQSCYFQTALCIKTRHGCAWKSANC